MFRLIAFMCVVGAVACAPMPYVAPTTSQRTPRDIADSVQIASLARSITRAVKTDSARAARIYDWVAHNVRYDVAGYYAGRISDVSVEHVYRNRVAVCGGFVKLFNRMAEEVGLSVTPVLGFAKGFDYKAGQSTGKPNHSWTAVRVNGRWRLVDPTWGAGTVAARAFQPNFTWDYFLVDPEVMVLSHYPEESEWLLMRDPVRRSDFERMPLVPRVVLNAGFTPSAIRNAVAQSGVTKFPLIGARSKQTRVISAPVAGTLARGSRVAVDIAWPGARDVALVSGKSWTHLRRDGDRFRGEAPASGAIVSVVGRESAKREFETLLQYDVR